MSCRYCHKRFHSPLLSCGFHERPWKILVEDYEFPCKFLGSKPFMSLLPCWQQTRCQLSILKFCCSLLPQLRADLYLQVEVDPRKTILTEIFQWARKWNHLAGNLNVGHYQTHIRQWHLSLQTLFAFYLRLIVFIAISILVRLKENCPSSFALTTLYQYP